MRRPFRYCLKRCQPKLSWNPRNCYNISRWQPPNDKNMSLFQLEWKNKAFGRLFFHGDVTSTLFRRSFEKNHRNLHATLEDMERRLDNTVFRSLFASSIFSARKLVSSGAILVNNRRTQHPDYRLSPGDIVSVAPEYADKVRTLADHPFIRLWSFIPAYLEVSSRSLASTLIQMPTIANIPHPFNQELIDNFAAFYTKR